MLTLQNLTVSIADKKILSEINFEFENGKVYALMGQNGSGKSTLARSIMGDPAYTVSLESRIFLDEDNITDKKPHERARLGLFVSFQSPPALAGINSFQLLRNALEGSIGAVAVFGKVREYAKKLNIPEELLLRSVNEGFSGGERKKLELMQAAVLDRQILFLDEIDTGVDVDALKTIGEFLQELAAQGKTLIIITHYTRILEYIRPDTVLVLQNGKVVRTGGFDVATEVEEKGYDNIQNKNRS